MAELMSGRIPSSLIFAGKATRSFAGDISDRLF
jgi:hypothetical protein